MAVAFCVACEDSKPEKKCVENDAICDNAQRFICTNGEYVNVPCAAGRSCDNGKCVVPKDMECLNGMYSTVPKCESNQLVYCNSEGRVVRDTCPDNFLCTAAATGAYCAKNDVSQFCTPNSTRCSGQGENAVLQFCDGTKWVDAPCNPGEFCKGGKCVECDSSIKNVQCVDTGNGAILAQHCEDGKWTTVDTCNTALNMDCRNGACFDKFACNIEGAKQCGDGEVIQECQSSKWVTVAVCSGAGQDRCFEGACVDSSIPQKGDSCNPNTFTDTCSNNKVVYCDEDDDTIVHYNCSPATCAIITSGNETFGNCYDEYDTCTQEGASSIVCMPYNGKYILASAICTKANDGHLYKVAQSKTGTCAGGCNDDYTDCDASGQGTSSGGTCDVFNCDDWKCDKNGTLCGDYCKSQVGANYGAVCDDESAYCYARNEAGDSSCPSGTASYLSAKNQAQCLAVGTDESCLGGGGGEEGDYYDCGSDCTLSGGQNCDAYCASEMTNGKAFCYNYEGQGYVGCGASCTKEGQTGKACQEFSDGVFEYPTICTKIGSNLVMVDYIQAESDYKECSSKSCNATNTGCK